MQDQLTVVMLNWKRPHNVARFVEAYCRMPLVARVIVADCRGRSQPPYARHPKCMYLSINKDPGLVTRLVAAGLARTNAVMLADDDIDLPAETVAGLHSAFIAGGDGLFGLFGRKPAEDGTYNPAQTIYGPVPIVLTRAVVTSAWNCMQAVEHVKEMTSALGGEPADNGEDIVLSYTTMLHFRGKPNTALKLPYRNVGYDDEHAISVRNTGHADHRTKVVRWCRSHLFRDAGTPECFSKAMAT